MSSIQQEIFRINAMDISQEEKAKKIFRVFNPIKIIEKKKFVTPICTHYKSNYYYLTNCCNKVYNCRFCHDENEDHKMERAQTKYIKCKDCSCLIKLPNTSCQNKECSLFNKPDKYFCGKCNIWFNDIDPMLRYVNSLLVKNINITKECYHCDKCGICRVGNRNDYQHCDFCNLCIKKSLIDNHNCLKKNIQSDSCPICLDNIWESKDNPYLLKCGHVIHTKCFLNNIKENNYQCPCCKKSMIDMTEYWKQLDIQVEYQKVPEDSEYYEWKSYIHCNDCEKKNIVSYQFFHYKCKDCGSYNTVLDSINKN